MIKKILSLILMLLLVFASSFAQDKQYGVRGAINYSQLSGFSFNTEYRATPSTPSEVPEEVAPIPDNFEDSRIGISVGFFAAYPLNEKIYIQPEIQFSSGGNNNQQLRVNAISFPVVVNYNFSEAAYVQIGPEIGFKVWEWEKNDNMKTFLFSGVIGGGYNITENIFVTLRYSLGITNVFANDAEISIERTTEATREIDGIQTTINILDKNTKLNNLKGKNSYLQLSFGYRL